jgi:hypothetical protein
MVALRITLFTAPLLALLLGLPGLLDQAHAGNEILGELALKPASRVEKNAGVWVDGQYMGFLKELKGKRKVLLVPGDHQIAFKLGGFLDLEGTISMRPGERKTYRVQMEENSKAHYPELADSGRVYIEVEPQRAAVFVDGNYAGHVDEFNGRRGMRVSAGNHEFKITLPGYQSFVSQLTVNKGQRYKLETELARGDFDEIEEAE